MPYTGSHSVACHSDTSEHAPPALSLAGRPVGVAFIALVAHLVAWRRGNAFHPINEVTLRRAGLALRSA